LQEEIPSMIQTTSKFDQTMMTQKAVDQTSIQQEITNDDDMDE